MSFSAECTNPTQPVATLEYCDMAGDAIYDGVSNRTGSRTFDPGVKRRSEGTLVEEELTERIARECAEAAQQTEQRLRQEYEAKLQAVRASVGTAIAAFEEQRSEYFVRAEAEIVQLALSIAAKILHREAQVDPMLVAALVRMTLEKMRESSSVTVRVGAGRGKKWKEYFAGRLTAGQLEVVEDPMLNENDCVLETELGTTNFGLDTQLKEIERGFFDLLALRPESR
jgi:flagellar assembly protein FliH